MNKTEAAKLLALIKVAYPNAYRDMDKEMANATVNMWTVSFPDVPLEVMEQAFGHHKMVSKFPPTVAEMVEELKEIHQQAQDGILVHRAVGNREMEYAFRQIAECTRRYKNGEPGRLDVQAMLGLMGGRYAEENGSLIPGCRRGPESGYELRQLEGPASAYR